MDERTLTADVRPGESVTVAGRIEETRDLGPVAFLVLEDRTGRIQVTFEKADLAEGLVETALSVDSGTAVAVTGTVEREKRAPGGVAVVPSAVEIVDEVDLDSSPDPSAPAGFEWPTTDVGPMLQVFAAERYLTLYSLFVDDASGIDTPVEEVTEGIASPTDLTAIEGTDRPMDSTEQTLYDGIRDLLESARQTDGEAFREFATAERTEWAVFCLCIADAVADAADGSPAMDREAMETVFDVGLTWLREKDSPPGNATGAEWERFRSRLPDEVRDDLRRSAVPVFGDIDDAGPDRSDDGDAIAPPDGDGPLDEESPARGDRPDPTSRDFAAHVDPLSVRDTAVEVAADYRSTLQQVCALHRFVHDEVTYISDPRDTNYVAPPNRTLEVGGGDCDDQGVLVASLCEAIGVTTRLAVTVTPDGRGHLFPEVRLDLASSESISDIQRVVDRFYDVPVPGILRAEDDGGVWIPADPTMGQYLGDGKGYRRKGYMDDDGWHHIEYYHP